MVRDTRDRYQKSLDVVLKEYVRFVKPSFEDFILPSKKYADVIIPRGTENAVAIDLLTNHISDILSESLNQAANQLSIRSSSKLLEDDYTATYSELPN